MKDHTKKIFAIITVLLIAISLCACGPNFRNPEPQNEEQIMEEPQFQEPVPEPPNQEQMMEEPQFQEPVPKPPQGDKSNNPNERKDVEGYVDSVNNDKVVIKLNDGSKFTLHLTENTEWDPGIETWDILPGNYMIARVALEGRTQGEVVYIMKNINAE